MNKYFDKLMPLALLFFFMFTSCHEYEEKDVKAEIYVNHKSLNMFVGDEMQLIVSPANLGDYRWISLDENVATVNNGKVTAMNSGNTDVVVTCGDAEFRVEVNVMDKIPLKDIKLSYTRLELVPGGSRAVLLETVPYNANDVDIADSRWWSDNEDVARASESGVVTGINEGVTTIHYRHGTIVKDVAVVVSYSFPFLGPHILSADAPLLLPFAHFDIGGEGYAFHDVDDSRTNDTYRANNGDPNSSRVDIEGGKSVGYTAAGEWLLYTLEVKDAGTYTLAFEAAAPNDQKGRCKFELDGVDFFGPIIITGSGGWGNFTWRPTDAPLTMKLTSGHHKLKFIIENPGFNIRNMKFTRTE